MLQKLKQSAKYPKKKKKKRFWTVFTSFSLTSVLILHIWVHLQVVVPAVLVLSWEISASSARTVMLLGASVNQTPSRHIQRQKVIYQWHLLACKWMVETGGTLGALGCLTLLDISRIWHPCKRESLSHPNGAAYRGWHCEPRVNYSPWCREMGSVKSLVFWAMKALWKVSLDAEACIWWGGSHLIFLSAISWNSNELTGPKCLS